MPRPTVVAHLPGGELVPVATALKEAGFELLPVATPGELASILQHRRDVGVALIDAEADLDAGLEFYAQLHDDGRDIPALLVVTPRMIERLARSSGATASDEYLSRPYSAESIRWRVEAMLIRAQTFDDGSGPILEGPVPDIDWMRRAAIITVFNPKGGVGKTSIAVNLATILQARRRQRILLVDADTVTGHIASSLGLDRVTTALEAWQEDAAPPHGLAGIASKHPSGLSVVVLATTPLHHEQVTPERVTEQLLASRAGYDIIIVDTHPDYGSVNLALFASSDRILVPVTPDVPAIRAAMQFLEVAGELGVRDRLSMVVNRANSGVSVADLERTIGLKAIGTIRSAGMLFVRAANEGTTVVERFPREGVTRDFETLADRLLTKPSAAPQPAVARALLGRGAPVRA